MLKDVFGVRWVEMPPQRSGGSVTYVPDSPDLPLSRGPRKQLELRPDGTVSVFVSGAADQLERLDGQWQQEGDDIVIRTNPARASGSKTFRIVDRSPKRLIVQE